MVFRLLTALVLAGMGCSSTTDESQSEGPELVKITPVEPNELPTALHFRDGSGRIEAEIGARGVALVDINGDGYLDATLTSTAGVRVLRGVGDGFFYDHPGDPLAVSNARGVAYADIEGDGDLDLYVSSSTGDRLFVNDGGWFTDGTESRGLEQNDKNPGTDGVTFADIDSDGDLDLYVCHAMPAQADIVGGLPFGERGYPNRVYRNDGTGHFTAADEPVLSGIATGQSFMGVFFDHNHDGRTDILIVHDHHPDQLLQQTE
ncbi:MAG: hypothetical protein ACI9OJ_002433, partial [Myxococcota bacterium]